MVFVYLVSTYLLIFILKRNRGNKIVGGDLISKPVNHQVRPLGVCFVLRLRKVDFE